VCRLVFCVLLALTLTACAGGRHPEFAWADTASSMVWPEPPQTPRIRFLRSVDPSFFVVPETGGKKLWRLFSGEKTRVLPLVAPYGVAADGAGTIWIADPQAGVVHIYDLPRRKVDYLTFAGSERLLAPLGVAWDAQDAQLYVSDAQLRKVFVYDLRGRLLGTRTPPGGYGRPAGMALDAFGNLYVIDVLNPSVEVFSRSGSHLRTIKGAQPPGNSFNLPSNVCVDAIGNVFVSDTMNFRVERFSSDGKSLGTIGNLGDVPGAFARPRGVAVDSEGHLYVADAVFDNVQIFTADGRLLLYFGGAGEAPGQFSLPAGLFFDQYDRLYVVDAYNQRIQIFQYLTQGER